MVEPIIGGRGYCMTMGLNTGRVKNQHHHCNPCSQKKHNNFCHGLLSPVIKRYRLQFRLEEAKTDGLLSRQWSGNYQCTKLKFFILYGLESSLQSRWGEFPWKKPLVFLSCILPSVFLCIIVDLIISLLLFFWSFSKYWVYPIGLGA